MASSTSSKRFPALAPEEHAAVATRRVLRALLVDLEFNQAEFLRDAAGDYLHDFRVALRRTRCALRQIKGVFPDAPTRRFLADFAALGKLSSATRDWEVGLQLLADQAGDHGTALRQPLRLALPAVQFLYMQRYAAAKESLKTHLLSAEHQRLLQDWQAFIHAKPDPSQAPPRAAQPIQQRVDQRIAKLYRRALDESHALNGQSPPEAWHALRKTCKNLRYLLELFHSLYPARRHRQLVALLKRVQEQLGTYQDCQVQIAAVLQLADEAGILALGAAAAETAPAAAPLPPGALLAMGALLQHWNQQTDAARAGFQQRFARLAASKTWRQVFR